MARMLILCFATLACLAEARLHLGSHGPLGTYGMPPCKRCGGSRLHSRDELLAKDDGELNKMQNDLSKEVEELEPEVEELNEKHANDLGKLTKRLGDINAAYTKLNKDASSRFGEFAAAKAKSAKDLSASLNNTAGLHGDISKVQASMSKLRAALNPYADAFVSGKGWPKGCNCQKAKALLQRLQVRLSSFGDSPEDSEHHSQVLLGSSASIGKPADQEKYKLVREVQKLEEKRASLAKEKADGVTKFSQQQRALLDRIDAAKIKKNLKSSAEEQYKANDDSLKKVLEDQAQAANTYLDSAKSKLARLSKNEAEAKELYDEFRAELKKCKCA